MKKALFFWLSLLLAGDQLPAQTPLITYGSTWKYLDNGTDQGTAWRSTSFNDDTWNSGNGKFGYGGSGITTTISFGANAKKKYLTTYFRKIISLTDLSQFTSFSAGVLRDDGIVVYVNGDEVYRNKMPTGTISYLTKASNADDNGTVTQTFTINKSAFVTGNNVIAVEIHQNNGNTPDMAFDLQFSGLQDQVPPTVVSILRQSPVTQLTNASTVIFRTTFSEKIRGIDESDFNLATVSGTAGGTLSTGAVAAVGTDSLVYDVTVNNVQGDGTLRLDLNASGTGITDTAGNAMSTGFTNGATYMLDHTAPSALSILRQSPTTQTTNATTIIFRTTFSEKVTGVNNTDFTLTTISGTASGVLATGAVTPVGTDGITYDVTVSSVQGEGTLRLDLNGSGTGIADSAGNAINAGFTSGETYIIQQPVQQDPPVVTAIMRQSPTTQVTNASTIIFRATFSKKVRGVDHADFTLTTVSGTAGGVLAADVAAAVNTDSIAYDVTVNSVQGDGTLRLDLNASGTGITDVTGNAINSGFTNGETYIIQQTVPEGPPIVTSINRQLPANEQTNATEVTFRVSFSEKVRGVDAADFIIFTQSGNARGTLTKVALLAASTSLPDAVKVAGPDSTAYDVTIRAMAGSGVLRLDVKGTNTGITDAAGNALSGGFTNGQTYTVNVTLAQGFQSFVDIDALSISSATREIPQTKVWHYSGKWWAVAATSAGTKILRLDNTSWTEVLTIATATNSRADCRVIGNLVHLVLFRGAGSTSYFVSLEYDPALNAYKRWTQRTSNINIVFETGTITATLDIDATGRGWIASNSNGNMLVRWSDAPYSTWSAPITIASGAVSEDICVITALPGKIGVLWSNQNAKRFGFKTHIDGDDPTAWSADEVPAGQTALNEGTGMADDHLNMVAASDGTLYCAVKTGYNKDGLPNTALLVRRPNNTWDNLYPVTSSKEGNRPIVVLNETAGKVKVMYSTHNVNLDGTRSGDILYRESSTAAISFGPPVTLMSGAGNYSIQYITSSHQTYDPAVVVWATNESISPLKAVGVLASDAAAAGRIASSSTTPALITADNEGKWFVYPNPFAGSTMVDFTLPGSGRFSVILFDSKGRRIRTIRQGWADAGVRNLVSIDGSHLAGGLYYIRVYAGGKIQTLKLLKR